MMDSLGTTLESRVLLMSTGVAGVDNNNVGAGLDALPSHLQ